MRTNGSGRSEQIQREIAATRSDMDHTLNEIQGRFTPGQLLDQGIDYVRGSGANEYVHNLGQSVKQNPVPMALVGIGLAWLMATGRRQSSERMDFSDSTQSGLSEAKDRISGEAYELKDRISGEAHDMKDRLSSGAHDMKDRLSARTDEMKGRVSSGARNLKEKAGHAREALSGTMHSAGDRVSRAREGARHQLERARGGFEGMLREQPLALGAIGIAIGALIAAAVPRTRTEDEMMGEKRDELLDRAKETGKEELEKVKEAGREQLDKLKDVAGEAGAAAKRETQQQGLMSSTDDTSSEPWRPPASTSSGSASTSPGSSPRTFPAPEIPPSNTPLDPPPLAARPPVPRDVGPA